ncbi:MAG TPA: murein transglycosylase domain-containing protein [Steroidobacteraceae bacterium]|nr:murein transglycosylase domain-containing protein [Steroidobacteraceae bacterium]
MRLRLAATAILVSLAAACATTQIVKQDVVHVVHGQPMDNSQLGSAIGNDTHDLGVQLSRLRARFAQEVATLRANAQKRWGKGAQVADKKVYVKYSQGYNSRVITDFDHGIVSVESRDPKDPKGSLHTAIVAALLTGSDPATVDLFSDKDVTVDTAHRPYLYSLIHDNHGRSVTTRPEAEAYATWLLANRAKSRVVPPAEGGGIAWFVNLTMVRNFEARSADRYRPQVDKYAAEYHVSPTLVLAIMRTESNFNPFAVSGAPAYGLMQLVPTSGGRAAQKRVTGTEETPTSEYLLDPDHNIQLGVAYLSVLSNEEFPAVSNQTSRDYCVIAAYNTGPGNVMKVFARDRTAALTAINAEPPPQLFEQLRTGLPMQETRDYVVKVTGYRKEFVTAPATPAAPAAAPAVSPAATHPASAAIAGH